MVENISHIGRKDDAEQVTIDCTVEIEKNKRPISQEMASTMKVHSEMAIIGYWRKNIKEEFKCYHYFYIPSPLRRETRRADRKVMNKHDSTANLQ